MPSIVLVLLQFAALIGVVLPWGAAAFSPWGFAPLALATGVGAWTLAHNRLGNFSVLPEPRAGARLVVTGPYAYVRHPMYLAVLLFGSRLPGGLARVGPRLGLRAAGIRAACQVAARGSAARAALSRVRRLREAHPPPGPLRPLAPSPAAGTLPVTRPAARSRGHAAGGRRWCRVGAAGARGSRHRLCFAHRHADDRRGPPPAPTRDPVHDRRAAVLVVRRLAGAPAVRARRLGDRVLALGVHGALRGRHAAGDARPPHAAGGPPRRLAGLAVRRLPRGPVLPLHRLAHAHHRGQHVRADERLAIPRRARRARVPARAASRCAPGSR